MRLFVRKGHSHVLDP
jgi:hypothetical protein